MQWNNWKNKEKKIERKKTNTFKNIKTILQYWLHEWKQQQTQMDNNKICNACTSFISEIKLSQQNLFWAPALFFFYKNSIQFQAQKSL